MNCSYGTLLNRSWRGRVPPVLRGEDRQSARHEWVWTSAGGTVEADSTMFLASLVMPASDSFILCDALIRFTSLTDRSPRQALTLEKAIHDTMAKRPATSGPPTALPDRHIHTVTVPGTHLVDMHVVLFEA